MFTGIVNIVQRRKLLHCGMKVRLGSSVKIVSACNNVWHIDDKTYESPAETVTCKRCIKILAKADESGKINLR